MSRAEITTPEALSEEGLVELSLRPQRLVEFIGQKKVKESLAIAIEAAKARREPLDHILFFGPPGLGKTTLADLMARELGVNLTTTSGPALEKPKDLVGPLTNLREGDVLFIDEIHRLRPVIEEFLYPAMEDNKIDVRLSDGPNAQTVPIEIQKFTLVGATTRLGKRVVVIGRTGPEECSRCHRFGRGGHVVAKDNRLGPTTQRLGIHSSHIRVGWSQSFDVLGSRDRTDSSRVSRRRPTAETASNPPVARRALAAPPLPWAV
ncbi:MAG: AAA family ATPase [Gemmatimonadota bacterium]